jgi:hypothetical protein
MKSNKSNIIDFNDKGERVEIPNEFIGSWEKNRDSDSDCGVDMLYDDEKMSLLVAPTRDLQTKWQQTQNQYLRKSTNPAWRSMGFRGQSGPPFS